jgi:hypothetical protein
MQFTLHCSHMSAYGPHSHQACLSSTAFPCLAFIKSCKERIELACTQCVVKAKYLECLVWNFTSTHWSSAKQALQTPLLYLDCT